MSEDEKKRLWNAIMILHGDGFDKYLRIASIDTGVEAFIESLGLRPLDVGGLKMAHWLEGAGLVLMGLARHGVGNWDLALGATEFHG